MEKVDQEFRKAYTDDMEVHLSDLVPGLTPEDIKPDSDDVDYVIEADPKVNPIAGKARLFTLD